MSDIKHRERILEAIDQLRRRKARPDIQRICNFLLRRFSVSSTDTKADLQKCVEREIVLRVEYKGSISYRNAARKLSNLKAREGENNVLSRPSNANRQYQRRKFVALLTNAITELIVHEPDYLEVGVPGPELLRNILSKDSLRYTKKHVSVLLEREVENGGLIKMENGNYLPGPTKKEQPMTVDEEEEELEEEEVVMIEEKQQRNYDNKGLVVTTTTAAAARRETGDRGGPFVYKKKERKKAVNKLGMKKGKMENGGDYGEDGRSYRAAENGMLRVGSRRKRAKKVFDPSDNNLPKKRGRPVGSAAKLTIEKHLGKNNDVDFRLESYSSMAREQGGVCSVCHNNKKVPNDRLVACRECSNKAHVSCLNGEDMMLKMYPDNTWQCPHCKTCCICYETSDAGYLTVCSVCADAYHANCHEPPVTEKIRGGTKWLCINCQMPEQLQVNEIHPNVSSSDILFTHQEVTDNVRDKEYVSPTLSISDDSNHNSMVPSPTPPMLSPQTNHNGAVSPEMKGNFSDSQSMKDLDVDDIIDPSIPDASHWSYDDVYNYFVQYFPEEAKVFREQEIDGRSLLLMKRMDVLSSLKLKLGPALKIYRHVVKLQFRRDDPKLYWL